MNTLKNTLALRSAIKRRNALNASLRHLIDSGNAEAAHYYLEGAYWRFLDVLDFHFVSNDLKSGDWGVYGHPAYIKLYARLKNWWAGWNAEIRKAGLSNEFSLSSERHYVFGQQAKSCA